MPQIVDEERLAEWVADVDRKRTAWRVPGCAMAVIQGGEVVFSMGFGHCKVGEAERITPQTLFPIASATKPFTATSLAILVEEGKLDWDTPIQAYWPEFGLFDPVATRRITIRDVLCHRSGLPRHDLIWYQTRLSRRELMERLQYLEPAKDFRAAYQYQNLMFTAAGYLVEQVTGLTWEQFVKDRILDRLQMTSSFFQLPEAKRYGAVARPYRKHGEKVVEVSYLNNEVIGPAGSLISTLDDMTKWLLDQLRASTDQGPELISRQRHEELRAPQIALGPHPSPFPEIPLTCAALGWFVQSYRQERMIFHAGNLQGFSSLISFLPEKQCAVVVLSQVDQSRLPHVLTYEAYDRLLGLEPIDWQSRMTREAEKEAGRTQKSIDRMRQMRTERTQQKEDVTPCTAAKSYTGIYQHAGYGQLTITETDGNLHMTYNDMPFLLEPIGEKRFLATHDEAYFLCLPLTFYMNQSGDIISLSAQMEPADGAKEILFTRVCF